ncbi:hypothetical protein QYF36_000933 [Acer negundo]|nr:hypothetical protein QYF36_000933 [Acer negundo]
MKISSSFSSLMRTVVACKIEVVRNLNPSSESRLILKNVAGSLFDPASIAVVSVWSMLNKEEGDISRLATQLQHIIEQHNVCRVVVGPWPRSMNEEQAENDLIVGAAKIDSFFFGDLHNTGIPKDDVDYLYFGLMHYLEMAGNVAFQASSRNEISIAGDKSGIITAKRNGGLITYYLSGAISGGCLGHSFPAGPPDQDSAVSKA